MANSYFNFKQFSVHQERCAVKVGTDSCLFGAWIANQVEGRKYDHILDIGTGTGLLSLMIGQKNRSLITAIEIDDEAAAQAKDNFELSPWSQQFRVVSQDVKTYKPAYTFDVIVSNPPFFENDLRSVDNKNNLAKHSDGLRLKDLMHVVSSILNPDGSFYILLPYERFAELEDYAHSCKLFVTRKTSVRQRESSDFFRVMAKLELIDNTIVSNEISVKDSLNEYTEKFKSLLRDYYLYL